MGTRLAAIAIYDAAAATERFAFLSHAPAFRSGRCIEIPWRTMPVRRPLGPLVMRRAKKAPSSQLDDDMRDAESRTQETLSPRGHNHNWSACSCLPREKASGVASSDRWNRAAPADPMTMLLKNMAGPASRWEKWASFLPVVGRGFGARRTPVVVVLSNAKPKPNLGVGGSGFLWWRFPLAHWRCSLRGSPLSSLFTRCVCVLGALSNVHKSLSVYSECVQLLITDTASRSVA